MSQTHFGFKTVDEQDKARHVRSVFDSVASNYDIMNDLMSAGLHRLWKRYAITVAHPRPGDRVLDIAGGTGDLGLAFAPKVAPTGTVVQEFVNAQQVVFAVVWQGPVLPDLAAFFGDHYVAFQRAAKERRAAGQRGGALLAQQPDLVMVSRGRMGRFQGHAYIPSLVPSGVNIQALLP